MLSQRKALKNLSIQLNAQPRPVRDAQAAILEDERLFEQLVPQGIEELVVLVDGEVGNSGREVQRGGYTHRRPDSMGRHGDTERMGQVPE